ncbi:uncharacterized mitochondrial protein AtMg00810-like [Rutidosis leptorrhynchoides]|uniref:uncharacterized mitochondrial protein AtMg00810-like n=1 Tax=Rutidosis leptorrhynchoides TaxID=125765 RepID=UPI003A9A293D
MVLEEEYIMLVKVYVDDIIFGSTNQKMVDNFQDVMQKRFKMSSLGAINFFLGLQVDQTEKASFYINRKSSSGESRDYAGKYKGKSQSNSIWAIIGSLMYLTTSRPDIMFASCLCARYQAQPNMNHMLAAKKIMRYLKGTPSLALWYPRKDEFDLTVYIDSDYRGCKRDFKSTSGGCQFLGSKW